MGSGKRKLRLLVVKRLRRVPRVDGVAPIASFDEPPLMGLILPMTPDAGGRRLAHGLARGVASRARYGRVPSPQWEIGHVMAKRLAVEQDDVSLASLVVAVTVPAFAFAHRGIAPVKSLLLGNIGGDRFVTAAAEA